MRRGWVLVWVTLLGCQAAPGEGTVCARASDCPSPFVCGLGRCRSQCASARDCPIGTRCLAAAPGVGVCSIVSEASCTGVCAAPLRCENEQCRTECATNADCLAGVCVNATCVEPASGSDAGTIDAGATDGGTDAAQTSDAAMNDAATTDAGSADAGTDAGVSPDAGTDAGCSGCLVGTTCVGGRLAGECGYGGHVCSGCVPCASGVCSGGEDCATPFDLSSYGTYVFPIDTCALNDNAPVTGCTTAGADAIFAVHRSTSSQLHIVTDPPATIAHLDGAAPCTSPSLLCSSTGDFVSNGGAAGVVDYYAVESITGCGRITVTLDYGP